MTDPISTNLLGRIPFNYGAHSKVYKCEYKGSKYVVKEYTKKTDELKYLNQIGYSPHIVKHYPELSQESAGLFPKGFLVLERMDFTLCTFLAGCQYIKEKDEYIFILKSILLGLMDIHNNGVIHNDLHSSNILINDVNKIHQVKICDFTWSTTPENAERAQLSYGDPSCPPDPVSTFKSDMYAIGLIMEEMLGHRFTEDTLEPFSESHKDLIERLKSKDPAKRPNVHEVLNHPFLKNT